MRLLRLLFLLTIQFHGCSTFCLIFRFGGLTTTLNDTMAHKGFLDDIKKNFGSGNYAGDQFGGASGHDGSGLPTNTPGNFMFATGIECSYPTIQHGKVRRDLLRECGHYDRWKEDLGLVKEMGLNVLRYGLPYYSIHQAPGKFDWSFADEAMAELKRLKITPILDLMHFGVPDWVENYQNPELPVHFANYAGAVAKRYPWVRYFHTRQRDLCHGPHQCQRRGLERAA